MKRFQKVKGVRDLYDQDMHDFLVIENVARNICELYNFSEIRIPEFEHTEVFARENDSSDVVNKEMYTFLDQGNRSLTLRPEWTAGIVRSVVENKLYAKPDLPLKYFYLGTNFRSENPQKGRYRIFNQFGVESIGVESPFVDAEVMALGYTFISSLGLKEFKIELNTIGDKESRLAYNEALVEHFEPVIGELCTDCKRRLKQNPLRILDCKVDFNHPSVLNAPYNSEYLNKKSKDYYLQLKTILKNLSIPFTENPRMVRGLDYYSHTVFEYISTHKDMGAQSTILGGGHYGYLVEQFGGPEMAGIGFGLGIERLILALQAEEVDLGEADPIDAYVMVLDEEARTYAMQLSIYLKAYGFKTDMNFAERSFRSQFKTVDRLNADLAILIGNSELEKGEVTIKNTITQAQETIKAEKMVEVAAKMLEENAEIREKEQAEKNHECQCKNKDGEDCHKKDGEDHDCQCQDKNGQECECQNHKH